MSEEPRNAGAQQRHSRPEHKQSTELTKRNADFMHRLRKELQASKLSDEQRQAALIDTETQLLEGQKTGTTAKQLFGTPTDRFKAIVEVPKKAKMEAQSNNIWLRAADNGLIFMALFAAMYALMMLIQPKTFQEAPGSAAGPAGILAIILTSAVGGLGIAYIYRLFVNRKKRPSLWKQTGITVLAVILWIIFYTAFGALPPAINPMLPLAGYIILAVAAFAGRWYLRRKFHIVGGLL
ncbi:DUF1129 domain-containing protein [Pediococcus acidilactici]